MNATELVQGNVYFFRHVSYNCNVIFKGIERNGALEGMACVVREDDEERGEIFCDPKRLEAV